MLLICHDELEHLEKTNVHHSFPNGQLHPASSAMYIPRNKARDSPSASFGMDIAVDVEGPSTSKSLGLVTTLNNFKNCTAPPERKSADLRLVARHPEVYEPCDDSFALVDALLADRAHLRELGPSLCLEVGCGSGYVITSLALMLGGEVEYIATDTNDAAARCTMETLRAHNVDGEVFVADLVAGLEKRVAGAVDVLVFNPPYVPTAEEEVGVEGIGSAWSGGERGRAVIDRMLERAPSLLSSRGCFYLVTVTANNPGEICQVMRRKGFASRIVIQRYTEEESLHVLKFWRDALDDCSDSGGPNSPSTRGGGSSSPRPSLQASLSQRFSRLVSFNK